MSSGHDLDIAAQLTAKDAEIAQLKADAASTKIDLGPLSPERHRELTRKIIALERLVQRHKANEDLLNARVAVLREALVSPTVHLLAAISLLEKGGKKAAPSDKMFEIMLDDYRRSVEEARAAHADLDDRATALLDVVDAAAPFRREATYAQHRHDGPGYLTKDDWRKLTEAIEKWKGE